MNRFLPHCLVYCLAYLSCKLLAFKRMTTGRYGTDGDDTNHPSQQDTNHPNQQDLSVEALTEMIETMELSDIAEMETSMKVKLENELEKYKLAKNKMKALKRVEKSEEKKTLTKEKNLLAKIEKKTQREAVASISLVNSTAGHTTVLKIIPLNNTVRMLRFLRGSSLRMSRKQSTKIEMTLGDVGISASPSTTRILQIWHLLLLTHQHHLARLCWTPTT